LAQYSGTVIAVTHDRYLDNVAGWILELIEEKVFRGKGIILG
jgi:ATPase subunit of ABC transporter with duplicated ATPase domains